MPAVIMVTGGFCLFSDMQCADQQGVLEKNGFRDVLLQGRVPADL